jgi:Skp family chaperone for outer membrane proteins
LLYKKIKTEKEKTTMSKSLNEQIENAKAKIQQEQNKHKQLIQKKNEQDRKARTRRLIERGAMLESVIEGAETRTNEQIMSLLQKAFGVAAVRESANAVHSGNANAAQPNGANPSERRG